MSGRPVVLVVGTKLPVEVSWGHNLLLPSDRKLSSPEEF